MCRVDKCADLHDGTEDEKNREEDENTNHNNKNYFNLMDEDNSNISIH